MSENLLDAYAKALSQLEELAFQRAIVQRLLIALNNFQSVPSEPQGDGGVDGLSHKGMNAYCCYGLKYDSAKTPKQRARQIVTKFSHDLQRLYELMPKGKGFIEKENKALLRIIGAPPSPDDRIGHVSLIANWFESHEPLGLLRQNAAIYAAASRCRWVRPDADVVLRGPREFADQYGVDESTMLWLKHGDLLTNLKHEAAIIDLPDGPTFDSKMQMAETLLPDQTTNVRKLADLLRGQWQWSIAFEQDLSDRLPLLHAALERGRKRLLLRVLTQSQDHPWDTIMRAHEFAESVFSDDFQPVFGMAVVRDLASGEVARLVGACPINWKAAKPRDAKP